MEPDNPDLEAVLHLISTRQLWTYGLELAINDEGVIVLREFPGEKPQIDDDKIDRALAYFNARGFARRG